MKINRLLLTLALASVTVSQIPLSAQAKGIDATRDVIVEEESEMNFSDVSPNHWAYRAIKKLVEEYGVIGGFPDGTFRGNRNLTRYEAAAMLAKVMEKVEEIAGGGKPMPSGVNNSMLDKLKAEFKNELEDLEDRVNKLSKDQQDMQEDLDDTRDQVDMLRDMLPKVKVMGDASIRDELVTPDLKDFSAASPQVRLRLGLMGETMGGFTFGTRITTSAPNDITNQYISLGRLNSKLGINLDKLYVALRPWDGALDLTIGRHGNAFFRSTELNWDDDVTFDGAYLKLRFGEEMGGNLSLLGSYDMFDLGAGNYDPANPRSGRHRFVAGTDNKPAGTPGMFTGGVQIQLGGMDSVMFKLGGNYHHFTNLDSLAAVNNNLSLNTLYGPGQANKMDGAKFASKFQLATGTLMVSLWPNAYLPISLFGDVSWNLGSANQVDALGYVAGAALGKLKESGNFMLAFKYKVLGQDSVLSQYTEDQLGGTNVMAYEGKLGIQLAPMTTWYATGQMANNMSGAANTTYTLRTGVMQKF